MTFVMHFLIVGCATRHGIRILFISMVCVFTNHLKPSAPLLAPADMEYIGPTYFLRRKISSFCVSINCRITSFSLLSHAISRCRKSKSCCRSFCCIGGLVAFWATSCTVCIGIVMFKTFLMSSSVFSLTSPFCSICDMSGRVLKIRLANSFCVKPFATRANFICKPMCIRFITTLTQIKLLDLRSILLVFVVKNTKFYRKNRL